MEPKPSFWKTLTRHRNIKVLSKVQKTFESFSITEKVIFLIFMAVFTGSVVSILNKISDQFTVEVPSYGGELSEGIVGTPRFINPLLAVSDADRDISELVYSGLLKATPEGNFIPDLAKSYTISPDGLNYTFIIRDDAKFHDGTPVTADDVEFTIQEAEDATLKSPKRVNWDGVTIQKNGKNEITFTLKQPYSPFISNLTMGIIPEHIWKDVSSDQIPFSTFNMKPIGSGPYIFSSIDYDGSGIPIDVILKANPKYSLGRPYIDTIKITFFSNEKSLIDAFKNKTVDSASNLSPSGATDLKGSRILTAPLARIFGIFFNQSSNEILARKEVRNLLATSIDKKDLVESVLSGFATTIDGPLPSSVNADATSTDLVNALNTMKKIGWKKNPDTGMLELKGKTKNTASSTISISLSTANIPELTESAKKIEDDWKNQGVNVDVRVFEPSDLNQSVIRPRKYDALLFGIVTGTNPDLYAFWHSSQRNDPGLNISLYANTKADKLLSQMRQATSTNMFESEYLSFKKEINNDIPAVFLWSPDFIYAVPGNLQGIKLGEITTSADRFIDVEHWYIKTDRVWDAFVKDKNTIIKN